MQDEDFVFLPIEDELDLHTFRPGEVRQLVEDYLKECRRMGILEVRVIHGKGTGQLRRGVHSLLERLPFVEEFYLAPPHMGGHGATIVKLVPPNKDGDLKGAQRP